MKAQATFIANWKMHGSRAAVRDWINILANSSTLSDARQILCPPYGYLETAQHGIQDTQLGLQLGAQNVFFEPQGAYTGEMSAAMLKELGCTYVLIGHSERRHFFQEPSSWVPMKMKAALAAELVPILCVGETRETREAKLTEQIIEQQLKEAFSLLEGSACPLLMIAYEPIWAIGTGLTASPDQAQSVLAFIRTWVERHLSGIQERVLLYGGSANTTNAASLMAQEDIDGLLIGGASLKAEDFSKSAHPA